ncbi:MAG: hypothetical protein FWC95_04520 [Defluviitaleaceae bacterium]|nr:hypothetical protein [Defluviitaleaceae bacterium]
MKNLSKIFSVLFIVIALVINIYTPVFAGGNDPILPPLLPPCPICNPEGRSVDPPGSYTEEK